jgi:2-polyprenyl-6-methoxyphenol hydroxylase-like FAD-dependent oxidoreductase
VLSTAFERRARELPNIRIWDRAPVRLERILPDRIDATVRDTRVSARLVVGADGLRSGVRNWAGIRERSPRPRRLGARQHFACEPWSDFVEVTAGDGVEAYVTPSSPRAVNVAFLWDPARHRAQGGAALIPSLVGAFPDLAQRLRGARPLDTGRGTGPLRHRVSRVIADGTVLVGDAAGYYDACTGEGLGQAVAQSWILGRTVVPCLRSCDGVPRRAALASYARGHRRVLRPYTRATRLMMFAQRRPSRSDRFTRIAAQAPEAMQMFLSYLMGVRSGWEALPLVPRLLMTAIGRPSNTAAASPGVSS